MPGSRGKFLGSSKKVVIRCGSQIVTVHKKYYMHKIPRRMRVDKFNRPLHSNITSACEIFKSWDAANFDIVLLVSFFIDIFNSCGRTFLLLGIPDSKI